MIMCEYWYGYASKNIKANSERCFDLITISTNMINRHAIQLAILYLKLLTIQVSSIPDIQKITTYIVQFSELPLVRFSQVYLKLCSYIIIQYDIEYVTSPTKLGISAQIIHV